MRAVCIDTDDSVQFKNNFDPDSFSDQNLTRNKGGLCTYITPIALVQLVGAYDLESHRLDA